MEEIPHTAGIPYTPGDGNSETNNKTENPADSRKKTQIALIITKVRGVHPVQSCNTQCGDDDDPATLVNYHLQRSGIRYRGFFLSVRYLQPTCAEYKQRPDFVSF